MKTFKISLALILSIVLFSTNTAFAQPNKKVSPALAAFTNTDFMLKFHDLRIEAESAALGVVQNQDKFDRGDFKRLRTSYDQTAQRANKMLEAIKVDFLDKKKLKMIAEYPEMYTEGLRFKLNDLADFYANNFQQTLADAQVIEEDGAAILLLITELIGLTKGLMDYVAEIKKEARRYNDAYLNQHLVGPYRWKTWGELDGSSVYKEPSAADFDAPKDRSNDFNQIESRMSRVTERYQDVKANKKTKADTNSGSTDDWNDTSDAVDDWGDDSGDDWDDWGDDSDDSGDDTGDDWDDWDGGANDGNKNFKYEEWNDEKSSDKEKKSTKKPDGEK